MRTAVEHPKPIEFRVTHRDRPRDHKSRLRSPETRHLYL